MIVSLLPILGLLLLISLIKGVVSKLFWNHF